MAALPANCSSTQAGQIRSVSRLTWSTENISPAKINRLPGDATKVVLTKVSLGSWQTWHNREIALGTPSSSAWRGMSTRLQKTRSEQPIFRATLEA